MLLPEHSSALAEITKKWQMSHKAHWISCLLILERDCPDNKEVVNTHSSRIGLLYIYKIIYIIYI